MVLDKSTEVHHDRNSEWSYDSQLDCNVGDHTETAIVYKCITGTKDDIEYKLNEFTCLQKERAKVVSIQLVKGYEENEIVAILSIYAKHKVAA